MSKKKNKELDKKIGDKIYHLRTKNRLSQREIGDILNCSQMQACNYERGKQSVSINNLNKLSKYFNVKITYFIKEL